MWLLILALRYLYEAYHENAQKERHDEDHRTR